MAGVRGNLSVVAVAAYAVFLVLVQLLYHSMTGMSFTAESVTLTSVGGVAASWIIGVLLWSLPFGGRGRLVLAWPALFVVQMFADLIEGAVFTTAISSATVFLAGTIIAALITFAEAVGAVVAFRSSGATASVDAALGAYFARLKGGSWTLRMVIGAVAYYPIYFFFGALVSPVVIPYYTDPTLGLGLTIPDLATMTWVELLRGALFVAALVPVIATMRLSRKGTFVLLAFFFYVVGAYLPFVAGTALPWTLRFFHSLEIFADSVLYGAVLTYLFKPSGADPAEAQP